MGEFLAEPLQEDPPPSAGPHDPLGFLCCGRNGLKLSPRAGLAGFGNDATSMSKAPDIIVDDTKRFCPDVTWSRCTVWSPARGFRIYDKQTGQRIPYDESAADVRINRDARVGAKFSRIFSHAADAAVAGSRS